MAESTAREVPWWFAIIFGRRPKWTVVRIVVLVVVCVLLRTFVVIPIRVEGPSMLPTYKDHRINFVNRLAYVFHEPHRGDVVAIRTSGESIMYMKRIIGLPGETVAFQGGHAVINGQVLDEPYVKNPCRWEAEPRTLGPSEYYFVGDNRMMPKSDHYEGKAERSRIVGKVLL
jgi:signal peptidase I